LQVVLFNVERYPELVALMGGPPRLNRGDILVHPRKSEAMRLFLDSFLQVYDGDPRLVRLLIETGRFLLYQSVALLEAAHDPARRETWPTVGLLKQAMAQSGAASARQIDDLVARMCAVGFLELRPAAQDRRVRLISASEKLRMHDHDWLCAYYKPLALLYPQHDYSGILSGDRNFQLQHRRTSVAFMPYAFKGLMEMPDNLLFLNRAGGYMVLASLLQAAAISGDQFASVPYGDAGDRFGISRTHVRNLLVEAESAGLVRLHSRGGHRVEILPRLWDSHDRGVAFGMQLNDMVYVATTRAMSESATAAA
jgi:hypothetical protein